MWIKYLYDKFLMRDLLGKITPGAIEAYALAHLLGAKQLSPIKDMPWPFYLLLGAAFIILALALQVLGEWIGVHSASPRPRRVLFFFKPKAWHYINEDFRKRGSIISQATEAQWTPAAASQRERFLYLKEGAGNLGIALFLVAFVLEFDPAWIGRMGVWLLSALLIATHYVHGKRQAEHELNSLWRTATKKKDELSQMAERLGVQLEKIEQKPANS